MEFKDHGNPLCDGCLLVWQKHWRIKTIKMMQPQLSARLTTAFRGLTMGFSTRTKPQLKAKKQALLSIDSPKHFIKEIKVRGEGVRIIIQYLLYFHNNIIFVFY